MKLDELREDYEGDLVGFLKLGRKNEKYDTQYDSAAHDLLKNRIADEHMNGKNIQRVIALSRYFRRDIPSSMNLDILGQVRNPQPEEFRKYVIAEVGEDYFKRYPEGVPLY